MPIASRLAAAFPEYFLAVVPLLSQGSTLVYRSDRPSASDRCFLLRRVATNSQQISLLIERRPSVRPPLPDVREPKENDSPAIVEEDRVGADEKLRDAPSTLVACSIVNFLPTCSLQLSSSFYVAIYRRAGQNFSPRRTFRSRLFPRKTRKREKDAATEK